MQRFFTWLIVLFMLYMLILYCYVPAVIRAIELSRR